MSRIDLQKRQIPLNEIQIPAMEVLHASNHGVSVTVSLQMSAIPDRRCVVQATAGVGTPFQEVFAAVLKMHGGRELLRNWTAQVVTFHALEHFDRCTVAMVPILLPVVPPDGVQEYALLKAKARAEIALLFSILDQRMERASEKLNLGSVQNLNTAK